MKTRLLLSLALVTSSLLSAAPFIVRDGVPQAEIIIAEKPPRSVRLAAADLQQYIEKMTGARLPISVGPKLSVPCQIYVGQSPQLARLGVTADGLQYGAFRIVSGRSWLALIGDDTDFVPKEPWARNNGQIANGQLQRDWEKVSGTPYGVPNAGMYKNRGRLPGDFGKPAGAETAKNERFEFWAFDERGSYNAVCGFLRRLGVRWYMPGEIGEVVPKLASIPLPQIDEIEKPDFRVRRFNSRFSTISEDSMFWMMRLGVRDPYGLMVAHGMHTMTHTEKVLSEHPDWFALYGGKRDTQRGERLNHLCYSNPELFQETVKWARAQFDVYDYESVSIMPPDAYISICQCRLCEGKQVDEMGSRGKLSNHVWDFVNRVAREVGRTHPDKKILCCAYGANTLPPTDINRLEPNVQVMIVGGRRPRNNLPDQREEIRQLRAGWQAMTGNPLMVFENYPFTARGMYLPAFVAHTLGESINATKGVSDGEDIWLSFGRDFDTVDIGFNHFQVYFTARMYWGGPGRDVDAMLAEYCRLFYGPAGDAMLDFFNYCEAHWQAMDKEKEKVDGALNRFSAARASVAAGSIHAKRLAVIDEYLESLRSKSAMLGQKRGPVAKLRTVWDPKEIKVDGKLDEEYWVNCPTSSTGRLRELQTGRQPTYGTTIKSGWKGGSLYFAIRCDEVPGGKLNITATKREDQAIWYGDAVEILLETEAHSYYQLAVNPAGALVDLDRGADKSAWFRWESQAEVATHIADDHWTIEIRIPVTEDENDPLNQVIGSKPIQSLPWHFNICRQRIRENGSEYSAFSPTGRATFHDRMKFAHFHDGRSHQFDVDPTVTDYLIASRAAAELQKGRRYAEALKAFETIAAGKVTELQKSVALQEAAACARGMKDLERADRLVASIPVASIAKTAAMENLHARRQWAELSKRFGAEAISKWPFWQAGVGYALRGRAFALLERGAEAERDLSAALPLTPDSRERMSLLRSLAHNRENTLKDDDGALAAYRQIVDSTTNANGAEYFYGVEGAARVLRRRGEHAAALKVLDRVDTGKLRGAWLGTMLVSRAQTLAAAGRNAEARKLFESVLSDKSTGKSHRQAAESGLQALGK